MSGRWVFQRFGGVDQVLLRDPEDLALVDELDEARWAATSVPVHQISADPGFLTALDTDRNGRIRIEEVRAARAWLWSRLAGRSHLADRTETLLLADLATDERGRVLRALADRLLAQLPEAPKDRITLAQVRRFADSYARTFPNGDGVVTPSQIPDPALAGFAHQVIDVVGGHADLGGDLGFRAADVDAFVARVGAFVAWRARERDEATVLFPLGDATSDAVALVDALAPKIAQFFAQCTLLALEPNAGARLSSTPEQLAALDVSDAAAIEAWMRRAPLAPPHLSAQLPLVGPVNPLFAADLAALGATVAPALLGRDGPVASLSQPEWTTISQALAAHRAWVAERPAGVTDGADPAALRAVAEGPLPAAARALAAQDQDVASELVAFTDLEKVLLLQRWLFELANNFVALAALFDPNQRAMFDAGVLVLDGRRLDLCLRVPDKDAHRAIAEGSGIFLVYCDLDHTLPDGTVLHGAIAAAVTAGTRGGIATGKRGVFLDPEGRTWDARVTDVIVQPVSVWEATVAPFERLRDAVASRLRGMIEHKAAEVESGAHTQATTASIPAAPAPAPAAPPAPAPAAGSALQGLLIGGSVAFAALGSALAFVMQTLASIEPLALLATVGSVVGALAGGSALLGYFRLGRRDLSALLEAGGWALNGRMRLSPWLGGRFTVRPGLPAGSEVRRIEPGHLGVWLALALVGLAVGVVLVLVYLPDLVPYLLGRASSPWPTSAP